jgi:hypothetical protein
VDRGAALLQQLKTERAGIPCEGKLFLYVSPRAGNADSHLGKGCPRPRRLCLQRYRYCRGAYKRTR